MDRKYLIIKFDEDRLCKEFDNYLYNILASSSWDDLYFLDMARVMDTFFDKHIGKILSKLDNTDIKIESMYRPWAGMIFTVPKDVNIEDIKDRLGSDYDITESDTY